VADHKFITASGISADASQRRKVVALESTVITHGLPRPQNLQLAQDMEAEIRKVGAVPATIAVLDGQIRVGLSLEELGRLSTLPDPMKLSQRDLPAAIVRKASGGTTVAATMFAAHSAGIRVLATGGIGGVHRESPADISADLQALNRIPMIVVCAGAKSILNIQDTLEYLETMGVPVVGFQSDEFPAFYSRSSGLRVSTRFDSPAEIALFARTHWRLGLQGAVLIANPIPVSAEISRPEIEPILERASTEAIHKDIRGQALSPFLLARINELTQGRSVRSNMALLLNNAGLAGKIAVELDSQDQLKAA